MDVEIWRDKKRDSYHRENGGTLGMVPLKGSNRGVEQLGYHAKGTTIFPMILCLLLKNMCIFFGNSYVVIISESILSIHNRIVCIEFQTLVILDANMIN